MRRSVVAREKSLLIIVLVGLGFAALVPPFLFRDRVADLPPLALRQLEVEASRGYPVPPGVMQILDARAQGEYPYRVEGTVVYRSLFGQRVAAVRSYNGATACEFAGAKLGALVVGFTPPLYLR